MTHFAIVKIAGKQYLVEPKNKIKVDKIETPKVGAGLKFNEVLLVGDEKSIIVGQPFVPKAEVQAEFLGDRRSKKIIVLRYKSKTRARTKKGHRQTYSELLIKDIKF